MMAGFIEELFYGNIDPQARGLKATSEAQEAMQTLSDNEALLAERLRGEDRRLLDKYISAWGTVNAESSLDSFIVGFRLGAAMAMDTFASDSAPFESFLK